MPGVQAKSAQTARETPPISAASTGPLTKYGEPAGRDGIVPAKSNPCARAGRMRRGPAPASRRHESAPGSPLRVMLLDVAEEPVDRDALAGRGRERPVIAAEELREVAGEDGGGHPLGVPA